MAYLRGWLSPPPADSPFPAVVLGGGLAGLTAARLLRHHFPRVVVLERDRRPETAPEGAFAAWERRGVPQFRHSPAFLARLRVGLPAPLPAVLDRPRAAGGPGFGLDRGAPPGLP